jgi:hypothetical protein
MKHYIRSSDPFIRVGVEKTWQDASFESGSLSQKMSGVMVIDELSNLSFARLGWKGIFIHGLTDLTPGFPYWKTRVMRYQTFGEGDSYWESDIQLIGSGVVSEDVLQRLVPICRVTYKDYDADHLDEKDSLRVMMSMTLSYPWLDTVFKTEIDGFYQIYTTGDESDLGGVMVRSYMKWLL